MSDSYIELIPQVPAFVPTQEAVRKAVRLLEEIAADAWSVTADVSQDIKFRDCGENFESVSCPECGTPLLNSWWSERMSDDYNGEGFTLSSVQLPCGHTVASLNELKYDWEQGFSKFALTAMNPNIGGLEPSETAALEECLGCKLRVIYCHT